MDFIKKNRNVSRRFRRNASGLGAYWFCVRRVPKAMSLAGESLEAIFMNLYKSFKCLFGR